MRDTRTSLEKLLGADLREHTEGECLRFEQLWALAQRGHRARDYHSALRHIATCTACRRAYLELRAIQHMQAQGLLTRVRLAWRQRLAWALAVSVAVAVVALAWWVWTPRHVQIAQQLPFLVRPETLTTPTAPEPKSTLATPYLADEPPRAAKPSTDDPLRYTSPIERELASIRRVEPFIREAVSAFTALIATDSIRSDNSSLLVPPIRLLEPDIERNAAIADTHSSFRWQPIEQARGYQLQIREADGSQVLIEATLDRFQTYYSLPPEARLTHGGKYELVLTALQERGEPVTLRRWFRVFSDKQRTLWEWAQRHEQTHPLLSGMVYYYHLDRYTDAQRCLQRAQQRDSRDAQITRWLTLVEQRIRQREAEFSP